jgi:hypothetical protein
MEYQEHKIVGLREIGKDEKWLQNEIARNPSILGLGDLVLFKKELKQSNGGRLDMILTDPENESLFEIEIQLGETDPSHILRTIEYWDIETRRYPNREHCAVIIAEKISSRFFNVIWLLNRSIPIIAIELAVLVHNEDFFLHFTKVLDIYQSPEPGDEQPDVLVGRQYWEQRTSPEAMAVFDYFIRMLENHSLNPKLNFRQDGIALAGKWNFAMLQPRKSGDWLLRVGHRLPEDFREQIQAKFQQAGVSVNTLTEKRFSVRLNQSSIDRGAEAFAELVGFGIAFEG